jgi:hypothetical protein
MRKKDISSLSLQPKQTKRTTIMTQVTKNNIVELSADDLNVVTGGYASSSTTVNGKTTFKEDKNATSVSSGTSASSDGTAFDWSVFS